jgi:hypothetical protein
MEHRGHHKKGITILNGTEVSKQQKFMFQQQNVFLKTGER